ncbi:MAG: HEPN domain-containing protein, partial [Desulforhopalus sp.]
YLRDGEQFLKTANGAFTKRAKAFSPETLYNLTCMAIEKLIMAYLMKNGDLAENHTMGDLLLALERHLGHNADIAEKLRYLDQFQEICDLDSYSVVIPTENDVVRFLSIGDEIRKLLLPHLSNAARKSILQPTYH